MKAPATPANLLPAACIVGTLAFVAYSRTLLPGVDLGDTGGFQAAVLWPETSARQAYPLYYTLARPFVLAVSATNPARGLNLFSALTGGAAVALLTIIAGRVARSTLAGVAAGLLLASSYTFWTQAVIAEVYALHLALLASCLLALYAYAMRPATSRLALFFAIYALSFGNHLTMILLLVPFASFIVLVHPRPSELFRPRPLALALAIAAAGVLLYLPNFLFIWTNIDAPPGWRDRVAMFWFDTTKADWRETMVAGVSGAEIGDRLRMMLWDARQQVGIFGLGLAAIGVVRLWILSRPWAVLVTVAFAINSAFALTYNVGDPHVFHLPGHFLIAFAAAMALAPSRVRGAWISGRRGTRPIGPNAEDVADETQPVRARTNESGSVGRVPPRTGSPVRRTRLDAIPHVLACVVIAYAAWRGWDTWPAADRSADRRADLLVARIANGVDDSNGIILSQMDWQSENALLYSSRYERRNLTWTRLADVLPHLPFFVDDNHRIQRDVVLTSAAAADVLTAYGPAFALIRDHVPAAPSLSETSGSIARGTPYVMTLLTPTPDQRLDRADFESALATLTGGKGPAPGEDRYQIWAGVAGERPAFHRAADRPFRTTFSLLGDEYEVRIDAWLPFDMFRRGGFGHVVGGRRPLLIVERGASLLWLAGDDSASTAYAGGLYAPRPRFRIPYRPDNSPALALGVHTSPTGVSEDAEERQRGR